MITPAREASGGLDALVIGGGPAGAVAGRLLALWGHTVRIVTRREPPGPCLAESLPPSCRKLFDEIGISSELDRAGFRRTRGNTVWWGDGQERSERFVDDAYGYQVIRRDFDRLLLRLAEAAGAKVYRERVCAVETTDDSPGSTVTTVGPDGKETIVRARYVLDCSGRVGVLARRGLRRPEAGQLTTALVGIWRRDVWGLADESDTLVETYADGWAWSVPAEVGQRYVTVMVDPRLTNLRRVSGLETAYRDELRKTRHLWRLVADADAQGRPWACAASPYAAARYSGPGFLLVGDAASFIDPLSSFGVKKALASAWLAAVVVHSALGRPDLETQAFALHGRREREMYEGYRRQTARYAESASRAHGHPFWTGRSSVHEPGHSNDVLDLDVAQLRRAPAVLAAFESLRRSDRLRLALGPDFRVERAAGIRGHEIVIEEQVVLPADGAEKTAAVMTRFLRGVDLPRLAQLAPDHDEVADLYAAYNAGRPDVALPDLLGALSVLIARGLLRDRVPDASS